MQASSAITCELVLEHADIALYASKHKGRACQTFYSPDLRESANSGTPPSGREGRKV